MKSLFIGIIIVIGTAVLWLSAGLNEIEYVYSSMPLERGDIVNRITVTGTVSPIGEVKVGSQLSGQLAERLVDFNHNVKKGQPLARLDATIFAAKVREAQSLVEVAEADVVIKEAGITKAESELQNARGRLAVAEARIEDAQAISRQASGEFRRREMLTKSGTVSKSDLDDAKAHHQSSIARLRAEELEHQVRLFAIRSAEAALHMARAEVQYAKGVVRQRQAALDQATVELERTVIRAPIDGIVIGRDVESGQTVAAALEAPTLFTLARDLGQIEVQATVDEADIGRVHIEQPVSFRVAAYPEREFAGKVVEIRKAPKKLEKVVTYTVLISAENLDRTLLPGMTATISIVVESVRDVLKLPNAALRFQPPDRSGQREVEARREPEPDRPADRTRVVWVPDEDGRPAPLEIRIGLMGDYFSELVAGELSEGGAVLVGFEALSGGLFSGITATR